MVVMLLRQYCPAEYQYILVIQDECDYIYSAYQRYTSSIDDASNF